MIGAMTVGLLSQGFVPLALVGPPVPLLFLAEIVLTAAIPVYNVTQISLRQRIIPAERLGRVNATMRTIVSGTLPLGMLLGGTLGNVVGIVPALFTGMALACCSVLWLLAARVYALRPGDRRRRGRRVTTRRSRLRR